MDLKRLQTVFARGLRGSIVQMWPNSTVPTVFNSIYALTRTQTVKCVFLNPHVKQMCCTADRWSQSADRISAKKRQLKLQL